MSKLIICSLLALSMAACSMTDMRIQAVERKMDAMEKGGGSEKEWAELDNSVAELEYELEHNRSGLTKDQVKRIGLLKGRHARIRMGKSIEKFGETLEDIANELEGFAGEDKTDTENQ